MSITWLYVTRIKYESRRLNLQVKKKGAIRQDKDNTWNSKIQEKSAIAAITSECSCIITWKDFFRIWFCAERSKLAKKSQWAMQNVFYCVMLFATE